MIARTRVAATVLSLALALVLRRTAVSAAAPVSLPRGPHETYMPGAMTGPTGGAAMGAVPGRSPAPAYPRGTVLLAQSLDRRGPTWTEWDVARARVVRQVPMGGREGAVRVVRDVDTLYVAATTPLRYLAIDATTLATRTQTVLPEGANGIAVEIAHESGLTAIAWYGGDCASLNIATLDAGGHVRGTMSRAINGCRPSPSGIVAVLGHQVYVVVDDAAGHHALLIAPDASVVRELAFDSHGAFPSLAVQGGRVLVVDRDQLIELTSRLDVVRHQCGYGFGEPEAVAVAADGRILTSEGDVLSPDLAWIASYEGGPGAPAQSLWLADTPVVLSVNMEDGAWGWITWSDVRVPSPPRRLAPVRCP